LDEIEEWNEFGELKENIGPVPAHNASASSSGVQGVNIRPPEATSPRQVSGTIGGGSPSVNKAPKPLVDKSKMVPLPGAAEIAAKNKQEPISKPVDEPPKAEAVAAAPAEKEASVNVAKALLKEDHPGLDHLSAPPSAMQSGTVTPQPEPAPTSTAEVGGEAAEKEPESTSAVTDEVSEEPPPRRRSVQHRGSEVMEASLEEIRKIERENALKEEDEDEEGEDTSEAVKELSVKDDEKPQEQDAKAGEDATKSVQD
jgi:hypothetical protein